MTDIIINAREFKLGHPNAEIPELSQKDIILSDQLRSELNRIYTTIEGGREIIEKCQEEALNKLDTFEKTLNAKR